MGSPYNCHTKNEMGPGSYSQKGNSFTRVKSWFIRFQFSQQRGKRVPQNIPTYICMEEHVSEESSDHTSSQL